MGIFHADITTVNGGMHPALGFHQAGDGTDTGGEATIADEEVSSVRWVHDLLPVLNIDSRGADERITWGDASMVFAYDFFLQDEDANAFVMQQGGNAYMRIDTTTGVERFRFDKGVAFPDFVSDGLFDTGEGVVYVKTITGIEELFFNSDGGVVQITSGGAVNIGMSAIPHQITDNTVQDIVRESTNDYISASALDSAERLILMGQDQRRVVEIGTSGSTAALAAVLSLHSGNGIGGSFAGSISLGTAGDMLLAADSDGDFISFTGGANEYARFGAVGSIDFLTLGATTPIGIGRFTVNASAQDRGLYVENINTDNPWAGLSIVQGVNAYAIGLVGDNFVINAASDVDIASERQFEIESTGGLVGLNDPTSRSNLIDSLLDLADGAVTMDEMTAPGTPSRADSMVLYAEVDGTDTVFKGKFQDGTVQEIARQNGELKTCFTTGFDPAANKGDFQVLSVGSNGTGRFSFFVPTDFVTLVSLEVLFIAESGAAGAGKDIDLTSDYGADGESFNNHSESDAVTTYTLTADVHDTLDISGVFSVLAASDICGIAVKHNAIGGSVSYLGTRLVYRTA